MGGQRSTLHERTRSRSERRESSSAPETDPIGPDGRRRLGGDLSRRTLLRASAGAGLATAGLLSAGTSSVAATSGGDVIWTYGDEELDCMQASTFTAPVTVVDGRVYAGTSCAHMHVVDAAAGEQVETVYANATTGRAPTVVDDVVVFVPNNQDLKAHDLLEEDPRSTTVWEAGVGGSATTLTSSPTASDGNVYVSNHDGPPYLHTLDLWTGQERWTFDETPLGRNPVVVDGTVYVDGEGGTLFAFDAESGDEEWSYDTGEAGDSSPTVADGLVYAGTDDGTLYAVDATTGDEEWRFDLGGAVTTTPTVAGGTVYAGGRDDHLYALDAATGDEEWQFDAGGWPSSATVADGIVFVANGAGSLFAVDATTGDEEWRFDDPELVDEDDLTLFETTAPVVVDGTVYFTSSYATEGLLYALEAGVDGSSEDSRVALGTSGHHDAWAEAAAGGRPADVGEDGIDGGSDDAGGGEGTGDGGGGSGADGGSESGDGSGGDGSDGDDGSPGPGVLGALAGIGGAAYLLARRSPEGRTE